MENKVAYICDGLDPRCSGKVGCFKCMIGNTGNTDNCYHTLDPDHAVYGSTQYPALWTGVRFKVYECGDERRYFEEWDKSVIEDLCKSKQILLKPNEPFRDMIFDAYNNKTFIFSEGENNNDEQGIY